MSVSHDLYAGAIAVGGVAAFYIGVRLLWWSLKAFARYVGRLFLPMETKLHRWLRERAMARALGIDVEIIRARRRIEDH